MTYKEFRDKYNNTYIDYDNCCGNQCWDLAQQYFTECLNVPEYVLGGCGLVSNMLYPPKRNDLDVYFDEVDTTKMEAGDVCIWEYGHIAIYDNCPNGKECYYFSQNYPEGSNSHIQKIYVNGLHAFRLKNKKPTITPNVERDDSINQIYVKVDLLRVRTTPSLNGDILGFASVGYYNILEETSSDNYTWYKIAQDNWIAYDPEWEDLYLIKDYKKLYEESLLKIVELNDKIIELNDKIIKAIEDLS